MGNIYQWGLVLFCLFHSAAFASSEGGKNQNLDPERFNHLIWDGSNREWFEWWYFKITVPESKENFFVTMGMVKPEQHNKKLTRARAILTFGDFKARTIEEENFELSSFSARRDRVDVLLSDSYFRGDHVSGHVKNTRFDFTIRSKWLFNAMGWGMFIPRVTNIGWFPAQADAVCTGEFETHDPSGQNKVVRFKEAPCYQDRNWGSSFPKWWAWMVSNQFEEDPTAALAIGGGYPKVLGREIYEGVSIGFRFRGRVYPFRINDFAKIKTEICFGKWKASGETLTHRIEIEAGAPPEAFMDLKFLTPQGEVFHDLETLSGSMTVRFYERAAAFEKFKLVTKLTTHQAGLEYGSNHTMKDAIAGECFHF